MAKPVEHFFFSFSKHRLGIYDEYFFPAGCHLVI